MTRELTLIDAHVHLHPCYALDAALDAAHANFAAAAAVLAPGAAFTGVLMLAEKPDADAFETLAARAGAAQGSDRWACTPTAEGCSLRMHRDDGRELLVTAGQQIVAAEDLEVLALGMRDRLPHGRPLRALVQNVAAAGAIPVLAWGFGKWSGQRGALVDSLLADPALPEFFLGDNGGRLRHARPDARFARVEAEGKPILSGSDPPPFPEGFRRIGAFGFRIDGRLDPARPVADLARRLRAPGFAARAYGDGEPIWRFVNQQVRMQLRKRLRSHRA